MHSTEDFPMGPPVGVPVKAVDASNKLEHNLLSFSSITIHNIASTPSQKKAHLSGTFDRAESFPAPVHTAYDGEAVNLPLDEKWAPITVRRSLSRKRTGLSSSDVQDLNVQDHHLELELGEKFGEGASGSSYAATVVRVSSSSYSSPTPSQELPQSDTGGPPVSGMPERVCVKWAKGNHCRSLAREAWFYEQLFREGGCEGVITPRCFGFFTMRFRGLTPPSSPRKKTSRASDSGDSDSDVSMESEESEDEGEGVVLKAWEEQYDDSNANISLVPDDPANGIPNRFDEGPDCDPNFYDVGGLKMDSEWACWRQPGRRGKGGKGTGAGGSLIAILVLEELGKRYPSPEVDEDALSDIREIVMDLGYTGIRHYDIRGANILHSIPDPHPDSDPANPAADSDSLLNPACSPQFCHRHQKIHTWRLIDFDRATKTVFQDNMLKNKKRCLDQGRLVGNEYFLGTLRPWAYPYEY